MLAMREEKITAMMHSRYGFGLLLILSAVATVVAYLHGVGTDTLVSGWGPLFASPSTWFVSEPLLSLGTAFGLNLFVALLLIYINKNYNVLRSMSLLFAGMFLVMETAHPAFTTHLSDGIIMALVVMLAVVPLYSTFQSPGLTRRVFLSFCMISVGALIDLTCAVYLVAFLLGCFQMRCLNVRTAVAAMLGVVTPWWIAWGFGAFSIADLHMPQMVSLFSVPDGMKLAKVIVYAVVTMALGIGFGMFNLLKIYSYNARTRAYNGFFVVLSLTTLLLMLTDYNRLVIYIPMLNVCTALQIGHFFAINHRKRSYIPILCVIGVYVAFYLWSFTL